MLRFKVQPDKDAKYHIELSIDAGITSFEVFGVKRIDGKEEPELTPCGNIKCEIKSHKDLSEVLKHFYWALGRYKNQIDQQETEIEKIVSIEKGEKVSQDAVQN